jgi:pimeloyl-ACP methyl ester carboxylesterase
VCNGVLAVSPSRPPQPSGSGGDRDPVVVFVHGAFHGAWCWQRVIGELAARGVGAMAVELPYTSYEDDLAAVRAAVETAGAPVVLVGHSLGGGLVCAAGDLPEVIHLGYLCAMVVDAGQPVPERLAKHGVRPEHQGGSTPELAAGMGATPDGWIAVDPAVAAATFFSDCTPADTELAVAQLRPASPSSMTGLPAAEPWRTKPASYIFTTADRALPLEDQEAFAAGLTGSTHTLDSSHSPFWSRPAEVAEIITTWVAAHQPPPTTPHPR